MDRAQIRLWIHNESTDENEECILFNLNYLSAFEGEVPGLTDDEVSTTRYVSRAGCDHSETPDCSTLTFIEPESRVLSY